MGLYHGDRIKPTSPLLALILGPTERLIIHDENGDDISNLEYKKGPYQFHLYEGGSSWRASFKLVQLPDCCGTIFISDLVVSGGYRRKGYGKKLLDLIFRICEITGYNSISCIIPSDGYEPAQNLFESKGFTVMKEVLNARTANTLLWYHKDLGMGHSYYMPGVYREDRVASVKSLNVKEYM